jgi:predicted 3-demethylubiquinone-9 3-methyltransferase (glyoxalase superfamily)
MPEGRAEEAMNHYVSVFPDAKVLDIPDGSLHGWCPETSVLFAPAFSLFVCHGG